MERKAEREGDGEEGELCVNVGTGMHVFLYTYKHKMHMKGEIKTIGNKISL